MNAATSRSSVGGVLKRIARSRLVHALGVIVLVSIGVSLLVELVPGDPATAILGENANPDSLALARERLGLNQSVPARYASWAGDAATGDFGQSIRTNERVLDAVRDRLPVTIQLTIMAQLMALIVCFPLGTYMAYRAGRRFDRVANLGLSVLIAAPAFVTGVVLLYFFGVKWQIFPVVGWVPLTENVGENLRSAFLPAVTIALLEIATFTRLLRGDLVNTLQEDFILAARAKGLTTSRVLFRHAVRPSLFTLVTLGGLSFARLLGGTVIVETLFNLPGLGRLVVDAVKFGDLPVVQGVVVMIAAAYLVINMLVDASYGWIDPRVRDGRR